MRGLPATDDVDHLNVNDHVHLNVHVDHLDIDIDDTFTLTFTGESLTQGFASTISGDGGLNINLATGDDEMTLRGPNTYTGGTTLTMGTIVLGDDESLGIGVRVKNMPDGSVELVAIGPSASLRKFLEHCRTGPMGADIGSLDEEWSVAEQDEHPFFQIEP